MTQTRTNSTRWPRSKRNVKRNKTRIINDVQWDPPMVLKLLICHTRSCTNLLRDRTCRDMNTNIQLSQCIYLYLFVVGENCLLIGDLVTVDDTFTFLLWGTETPLVFTPGLWTGEKTDHPMMSLIFNICVRTSDTSCLWHLVRRCWLKFVTVLNVLIFL